MPPKKVCIIGSGNWGSVIAKIIGTNVSTKPQEFNSNVPMYVFEELVNGRKLSEIINSTHENVKYLPGIKLPENVVAVTDARETVSDADIIVVVTPHQFIRNICNVLKGSVKPTAKAVSLIKGIDVSTGKLQLISSVISECLGGIPCAVLMGANIALEVAQEKFCEATIGSNDQELGNRLKDLFETSYFRINVVPDPETVELCGALKNVVAMGAGFTDGLKYGENTKAAVIRLGLMEMVDFNRRFFQNYRPETYFESCGLADLITTCYSGRNRRVAAAFAASAAGKTMEELEDEMLNGQKLQGPPTAAELSVLLKEKNLENQFPLFTSVHRICTGAMPVQQFIDSLKHHPVHDSH